jgi:hypothetical protein
MTKDDPLEAHISQMDRTDLSCVSTKAIVRAILGSNMVVVMLLICKSKDWSNMKRNRCNDDI